MEFTVDKESPLVNKSLTDLDILNGVLIVMIKRQNNVIIPNGSTILLPEDILVVTGNDFGELDNLIMA
nr:TrkA C-terminal domain-containing protein [Clostridium mediterraneense]